MMTHTFLFSRYLQFLHSCHIVQQKMVNLPTLYMNYSGTL